MMRDSRQGKINVIGSDDFDSQNLSKFTSLASSVELTTTFEPD
jgi:hypothetical protein